MPDAFKLGEHEAKLEAMDARMSRIETVVVEIRDSLAEKRGERRVALWALGTASGAVGAGFALFIDFLKGK